jgi:hypothetical protein
MVSRLRKVIMSYVIELVKWLGELERSFAFLLSMPLMVVVAGAISHLVRRNDRRLHH